MFGIILDKNAGMIRPIFSIRTIIILIYLSCKSINCVAQRPMSLEVIIPKIDSIEIESSMLFSFIKAEKSALEILFKSNLTTRFSSDFRLTYLRGDTLKTIFISPLDKIVLEINTHNYISKIANQKIRDMHFHEENLLSIKRNALAQITTNYLKSPLDGFEFCYAMMQWNEKFKIYALETPKGNDKLTITDSYMYTVDDDGKIINTKSFIHKSRSMTISENTAAIYIHYDNAQPFIYASDICLFRLYRRFSDLDEINVISRRNKRRFTYNDIDKRIHIQQ